MAIKGSDFSNAIIINSENENDGVALEHDFIQKHFLFKRVVRQKLVNHLNKYYDVLTVETLNGKEEDVYFDIHQFFKP